MDSSKPIFKGFKEIKSELSMEEVLRLAEYGYNAHVFNMGGIIEEDSL